MKILITGSDGFIGKNCINYFKQKGHNVFGIDAGDSIPNLKNFDLAIHLGAISSTTFRDVDRILTQNYDYSVSLLEKCHQSKIPFQYASSASVYGSSQSFDECSPSYPQSPYAWSKYLFDRFVLDNLDNFSVPVQGFRYFNVYGEMEDHKGEQASPYHKFTIQAKKLKTISLFENSDQYKRDFVCVKDICQVHDQMDACPVSGIFNVGTGRAVSFEKIALLIAEKYSADIKYIPMPNDLRNQYQTYTCANINKLKKYIELDFIKIEDYIVEQ